MTTPFKGYAIHNGRIIPIEGHASEITVYSDLTAPTEAIPTRKWIEGRFRATANPPQWRANSRVILVLNSGFMFTAQIDDGNQAEEVVFKSVGAPVRLPNEEEPSYGES